MTGTLVYAIVGHLVGDYLLQNDWMALNKKSSMFHCAVHCLLWTASVTIFSGWWTVWWVGAVLFGTHYIQDHTMLVVRWMKMIGQGKFATPPMAPWSIIVVDNVWHILTLALIAKAIGG